MSETTAVAATAAVVVGWVIGVLWMLLAETPFRRGGGVRCWLGTHDWRRRSYRTDVKAPPPMKPGVRPPPDPINITVRFEQCRRCDLMRDGWSPATAGPRVLPAPLPWGKDAP